MASALSCSSGHYRLMTVPGETRGTGERIAKREPMSGGLQRYLPECCGNRVSAAVVHDGHRKLYRLDGSSVNTP